MPDSIKTDLFAQGFPSDSPNLPLVLEGIALFHQQETIERPAGLPLHTWLFCARGSGELTLNEGQVIASEGMGLLLLAGTPYSYRKMTPQWETHFITFGGAACDQILQVLQLTQSGAYHVSDPTNLSWHFHHLARISSNEHRMLSKALYALLLDLALNVRYLETDTPAVHNDALLMVVRFIEAHYHEVITLDQLAARVDLRKEYLCTLFKKLMGQTMVHFIQTIRIAHARIALTQYPEKTVGEIGLMCGFESASYFGRVFRKTEGCTPQTYRQRR